MEHPIRSSDEHRLDEARVVAREYADRFRRPEVAGVVLLGAIVRGYYDAASDIDVAILTRGELGADHPPLFQRLRGFEIHSWVSGYETEVSEPWPMAKRWTYSESRIHYDPDGLVTRLVAERTRLGEDERRWMLMTGAALSEWYIRRLTDLWVERGSLLSAHTMVHQGLNHFYEMLFALNDRLVADHKWVAWYAERLPLIPDRFPEKLAELLTLREPSLPELRRRVGVFMEMWSEMLPRVERAVGRSYEVFKDEV